MSLIRPIVRHSVNRAADELAFPFCPRNLPISARTGWASIAAYARTATKDTSNEKDQKCGVDQHQRAYVAPARDRHFGCVRSYLRRARAGAYAAHGNRDAPGDEQIGRDDAGL